MGTTHLLWASPTEAFTAVNQENNKNSCENEVTTLGFEKQFFDLVAENNNYTTSTVLPTAITSAFWVQARLAATAYAAGSSYALNDFSASNKRANFAIWDAEGNPIYYMGKDEANYILHRVYLTDGTTVDLTPYGGTPNSNTGAYEWNVYINPGVEIKVYRGITLVASHTGAIGNQASTTNGFGQFSFGYSDWGHDASAYHAICADYDTRFVRIHKLRLSETASVATNSGGSTTDVTVLGQVGVIINTVRTNYPGAIFDTDGQEIIYPTDWTVDPLPSGAFIEEVVMTATGIDSGTSGVPDMLPVVRTGGTTYVSSEGIIDSAASYTPDSVHMKNNPATSLAWTFSDLTSVEYGIRLDDGV